MDQRDVTEILAELRREREQVRLAVMSLQRLRRTPAIEVARMLAQLRGEREQIDGAILSLERLAQTRGRRRGRPPGARKAQEPQINRRGG